MEKKIHEASIPSDELMEETGWLKFDASIFNLIQTIEFILWHVYI